MRQYAGTVITHLFQEVDEVGKVTQTQQTEPQSYLRWTDAAALASVQDFNDTLQEQGLVANASHSDSTDAHDNKP